MTAATDTGRPSDGGSPIVYHLDHTDTAHEAIQAHQPSRHALARFLRAHGVELGAVPTGAPVHVREGTDGSLWFDTHHTAGGRLEHHLTPLAAPAPVFRTVNVGWVHSGTSLETVAV